MSIGLTFFFLRISSKLKSKMENDRLRLIWSHRRWGFCTKKNKNEISIIETFHRIESYRIASHRRSYHLQPPHMPQNNHSKSDFIYWSRFAIRVSFTSTSSLSFSLPPFVKHWQQSSKMFSFSVWFFSQFSFVCRSVSLST